MVPSFRAPGTRSSFTRIRRYATTSRILVSLPVYLDGGRPVRVNVSMEAGLVAEIDEAARRRGLTRSAFLASAARDKMRLDRGLPSIEC